MNDSVARAFAMGREGYLSDAILYTFSGYRYKEKEKDYSENMKSLKQEKDTLFSDMDELLEEMERLEDGLENQKELRMNRGN